MNKIKDLVLKLINNRLVKGFMVIFTGQGFASILSFICSYLALKSMQLELNGNFIAIQSVVLLIFNICSFKTNSGVIKYVTAAITRGDKNQTKQYIKVAFILDTASMLLAIIVALLFRDFALGSLNLSDPVYQRAATIFIFSLFLNLSGTTTGIIGAFRKYSYMVYSQTIGMALKLIIFVILFFTKGTLEMFMYAELISALAINITLIVLTFKILKKEGLIDFYKTKVKTDWEYIKFNIYTNFSSTIDLPVNELFKIIIKAALGSKSLAVFAMFEKFGQIISKIGSPLSQLLYPELTIKVAEEDHRGARKIVRTTGLIIAGMYVCLLVLFAISYKLWFPLLIETPVGYEIYILPFLIYLTHICFVNATTAVHGIFLAYGYARESTMIVLIVNILFLALLYVMISNFGLIGAVSANLIQAVSVVVIKEIIMKRRARFVTE